MAEGAEPWSEMPDAHFEHPRLVPLYDLLVGERPDLDAYAAIVDEFGARTVVDLGCGTGVLARRLAARGITVTGIDPAAGSIEYAREQPGADRVRWILGDATAIDEPADLVLMTGNAAQAIVEPAAWDAALHAVPNGARFVFETRDPARRAWEGWTRAATHRDAGPVTTWVELTAVDLPLVSFRTTFAFADGEVLTSDSTLRFRDRAEVEADLRRHGFTVEDVRDAPDRPGLEFVFVATRSSTSP